MSAHWQDQSTRRAIWWTRAFARPLAGEFPPADWRLPEDMRALLDEADRRLGVFLDAQSPDLGGAD